MEVALRDGVTFTLRARVSLGVETVWGSLHDIDGFARGLTVVRLGHSTAPLGAVNEVDTSDAATAVVGQIDVEGDATTSDGGSVQVVCGVRLCFLDEDSVLVGNGDGASRNRSALLIAVVEVLGNWAAILVDGP